MKIISGLAGILIFIFSGQFILAQSFPCDVFCVTDIRFDSIDPEILNVTIFFQGNQNDFINYPYVYLVTDENNNTMGTGTLNFFGQIANTSQVYPVNTTLDSLPDNLMANVYFHYDQDTCVLSY